MQGIAENPQCDCGFPARIQRARLSWSERIMTSTELASDAARAAPISRIAYALPITRGPNYLEELSAWPSA
jgi:hypothetical protein